MTHIPLNGLVQASDGACGTTTDVVLNPVSHKVTHFAIYDKKLPDNPTRLVPADQVAGVTDDAITLNCSRADVEKMRPFVVEHLIQQSPQPTAYASAYASQYVFNDTAYADVQERDVPTGELAVVSGMSMEATDGVVGKLDELVLDEKSGEITHLLMREGHLWGKKDVAVPVSEVDFVTGDTIYIKLDKKTAKALPAVKVKRP